MIEKLPRDCTVEEWDQWLKENDGGPKGITFDGVLNVYLDLKPGEDYTHMVPVIRTGGSPGLSNDSRCVRSQLRRSIAAIDAIEDLFAQVIDNRIWPEGRCPCNYCYPGNRNSCSRCSGTGYR